MRVLVGVKIHLATGHAYLKHMISYNAFGLDEDLVDHGETMVALHLVCTMLIVLNQRQQDPHSQSLSLFTVTQFDHLNDRIRDRQGDRCKIIMHSLLYK